MRKPKRRRVAAAGKVKLSVSRNSFSFPAPPVVETFTLTCVLLYRAIIPARRVHEFRDTPPAA